MEEFWLISAPGEPTPKKMWEHVRERTKELSASHKFGLPEMQVSVQGTVASLHLMTSLQTPSLLYTVVDVFTICDTVCMYR